MRGGEGENFCGTCAMALIENRKDKRVSKRPSEGGAWGLGGGGGG